MIAYVVDADAVAKAAGPKRSGKLKIGKEDHRVSRHHVNNKAPGKAIRQEVEVVHFALEIDANPPRIVDAGAGVRMWDHRRLADVRYAHKVAGFDS